MRLIVAPVSVLFRLEHCHLNEFYSRARVFVIFIVFCSVVCCKMKKREECCYCFQSVGISSGLFGAAGRLHATH